MCGIIDKQNRSIFVGTVDNSAFALIDQYKLIMINDTNNIVLLSAEQCGYTSGNQIKTIKSFIN